MLFIQTGLKGFDPGGSAGRNKQQFRTKRFTTANNPDRPRGHDGRIHRLIPLLLAFFLVFMAGGLSLSVSQMGAIAELPKAAGKAHHSDDVINETS